MCFTIGFERYCISVTTLISKVIEAETPKYGLVNAKVLEKVYMLKTDETNTKILEEAHAEEVQRHIREVERVRRDHNVAKQNIAEELHRKKTFKKKSKYQSSELETYNCKQCGRNHGQKECPAYGQICGKCKRKGHFAEKCMSKTIRKQSRESGKEKQHKKSSGKVHETRAEASNSSQESRDYFSVNSSHILHSSNASGASLVHGFILKNNKILNPGAKILS